MLVGLTATGYWLRWQRIVADAINPDEIMQYHTSLGLWERGFPSLMVDKDMPPLLISTSELVYFVEAVTALVTTTPYLVIRFPALLCGTLVIPLVYLAGKRMFDRDVGLLAATICAFSPICIQYSDFGRYPSQLQLTTLTTVYLFWRAIGTPGPVNVRALWLTAASFLVMYLTWEGSARWRWE